MLLICNFLKTNNAGCLSHSTSDSHGFREWPVQTLGPTFGVMFCLSPFELLMHRSSYVKRGGQDAGQRAHNYSTS